MLSAAGAGAADPPKPNEGCGKPLLGAAPPAPAPKEGTDMADAAGAAGGAPNDAPPPNDGVCAGAAVKGLLNVGAADAAGAGAAAGAPNEGVAIGAPNVGVAPADWPGLVNAGAPEPNDGVAAGLVNDGVDAAAVALVNVGVPAPNVGVAIAAGAAVVGLVNEGAAIGFVNDGMPPLLGAGFVNAGALAGAGFVAAGAAVAVGLVKLGAELGGLVKLGAATGLVKLGAATGLVNDGAAAAPNDGVAGAADAVGAANGLVNTGVLVVAATGAEAALANGFTDADAADGAQQRRGRNGSGNGARGSNDGVTETDVEVVAGAAMLNAFAEAAIAVSRACWSHPARCRRTKRRYRKRCADAGTANDGVAAGFVSLFFLLLLLWCAK